MLSRGTGSAAKNLGRLLPLLLFLLVVARVGAVNVRHAERGEDNIWGNHDLYAYYLPVSDYAADQWRAGRAPLWNPYQSLGVPMVGTQSGIFYPDMLLYLVMPAEAAYVSSYLLHLLLAGIFMFLLLRELGGSVAAATVSGLAFMLSHHIVWHIYWPPIQHAMIWIPLVLLLVEKAIKTGRFRWAALLAAAVAMQYLAGYMEPLVHTLYAAAFYAAWRTAGSWARGRLAAVARPAALVAGGVALGLLLAAFQFLPTLELSAASARPPGGLSPQQAEPFGPTDAKVHLTGLVDASRENHRNQFIGLTALALALLAWGWRPARGAVAFLWALALLALALSLGSTTFVYRWYYEIPVIGSIFRLPVRFIFLYVFAMTAAAGFGAQWLIDAIRRRSAAAVACALAVALALAALLPDSGRAAGLLTLLAFAGVCLTGLLRWRPARAAAPAALALLVAVEMLDYDRLPWKIPSGNPEVFTRFAPLLEDLRARANGSRTLVWSFNYSLLPKAGTRFRLPIVTDYEPLSLRRVADYANFLATGRREDEHPTLPFTGVVRLDAEILHPRLLDLAAVRFAASTNDLFGDAIPSGWRRRPDVQEVMIWENERAMPRAWLAEEAVTIRGDDAILAALADPAFDPARTVVLEEEAPLPAGSPPGRGQAEITLLEATDVRVKTTAPGARYLVLTDVHYAGWEATVDGDPATIRRANYLMRAVEVPAGRHEVRFVFRPAAFRIGILLSTAALLGTLLGAAACWRRDRARAATRARPPVSPEP